MFTGSNRKSAFLTGLIGMLTVISMFPKRFLPKVSVARSLTRKAVSSPARRSICLIAAAVNGGLRPAMAKECSFFPI
jgi:hypothetical protein